MAGKKIDGPVLENAVKAFREALGLPIHEPGQFQAFDFAVEPDGQVWSLLFMVSTKEHIDEILAVIATAEGKELSHPLEDN